MKCHNCESRDLDKGEPNFDVQTMRRTITCNDCGEQVIETWEYIETERADSEVDQ